MTYLENLADKLPRLHDPMLAFSASAQTLKTFLFAFRSFAFSGLSVDRRQSD